MSERVRSMNLTSGNVLTATIAPSGGGCGTLIGAPTLISSTFNSSNTQSLTAMSAGHGPNLSSDSEPTGVEFGAGGNGSGAAIVAQLNFHLLPADGMLGAGESANSIMNSSQISTTSNESMQLSHSPAASGGNSNGGASKTVAGNGKHLAAQSVAGKSCRFPKLEECAHFHYERVQLGPLSVSLVDDKSELLNSSIASQSIGGDIACSSQSPASIQPAAGPSSLRSFSPSNCWFIIKIFPHCCDPFLVKRSFDNMQMLDEMLHRCVYDRKISGLKNLQELDFKSEEDVEYAVAKYLERFSKIASDSLTCGTILTWLQLDNKGRRLPLADGDTMRSINTPAVGAAYGVRRYQAQASDEISIEVGDMISVIDMPSAAESIWWRGKKSHLQKSHYEVGFFPQSCVATIGDKVPRHIPMPAPMVPLGPLDVSPTKPVLRKHGKLIAFFRSFILSRPSRRRLKQSGIYRERVFSCDLSEHLLNSGQEIPMVLKCCAEFIEQYGIVDGIYRLSGITSNIQRLRSAFDEERIPDLGNPEMKQDIHAVSSLLKMYFRELPNPLCTYQLYDNFVEAIQAKDDPDERLRLMKETVLKLPPPHRRTLKYLSEHLYKISQHSARTGMTDKNLAIVWAPNLLRSPALESGGVAALRGVGVQAVVTEYLISKCNSIFESLDESNVRLSFLGTAGTCPPPTTERLDSLTDCESLLVEQREHDQSLTFVERPKSLSAGGAKLISLEEAQERHSRVDGMDFKHSMPINMVVNNAANIGSYIEVGGGPASLPDKYHTVLTVPRMQKRKTPWKSLFTRNQRTDSREIKAGAARAASIDSTPAHHKVATQVTFADADHIAKASKVGKALMKQEKTKSIERFETTRPLGGEIAKHHMELCVRSNSIDSLRTAGHSRSVSHDSYFDLLQSPQRGHMTTCPSRELSELGINFDREEPEMHIFSESESLVSSPRVGKENIPPSALGSARRVLRARPEEYSSQTNSVNPSPKKQPRLNLVPNSDESSSSCQAHNHSSSDESCCKRYKLEDQLSDIQFIDCNTPEHTIANPQTFNTSVQIHAPPKSALSKSTLYSSTESNAKLADSAKGFGDALTATSASNGLIPTRYSYPQVQLGAKRKEQEPVLNANKERFSYPGTHALNEQRRCSGKDITKMQVEEASKDLVDSHHTTPNSTHRNVSFAGAPPQTAPKPLQQQLPKALTELLRPRNRNSFCGNSDQLNCALELSSKGEIERSKLSVTPSTPEQSPRYSLLTGETSSENSSAVTTPQYDLEPLMATSAMSGLSGLSGNSSHHQQQPLLLGVDTGSYLGTSHESLGSNLTSHSNITNDKRDMSSVKRELSLDLHSMSHQREPTEHLNNLPLNNKQLIPSPNNSNFTDNTSQSVTPSEFGYQHLQRQPSMHSLINSTDNSPTYEDYEHTPSNLISPMSSKLPQSPIKATISITYNLKGAQKEELTPKPPLKLREKTKEPAATTLLETSFDEHTVYEQVKFFRNSVTEVNQMLRGEEKSNVTTDSFNLKGIEEAHEKLDDHLTNIDSKAADLISLNSHEDVQMAEAHLDSLEKEKLLYENMKLRKPQSVYENILGEEMRGQEDKLELDSLDSVKAEPEPPKPMVDKQKPDELPGSLHRKSPSNFSVKELATKFERSPVEQLPAFDFSLRSSIKKPTTTNATPSSLASEGVPKALNSVAPPTPNLKEKLNKTQQITRSLDENAFQREFGAKHLQDLSATRSTQQLPELAETVSNRRKSFDFTRPKTLNPPKRLPGMPITEEICMRNAEKPPMKLQISQNSQNVPSFQNHSYDPASSIEHDYECAELKITPTTENRISLIQNNVSLSTLPTADLHNSNLSVSTSSLKVLSDVKLNRERIDKIKQERRQQLTEKYRNESFKSQSKTDLNIDKEDMKFHGESLRAKSKSRGDVRSLQKDIENTRDFSRRNSGSESTLSMADYNTPPQRVRNISDEKNQNCDTLSANSGAQPQVQLRQNQNAAASNSSNSSTGSSDDCPQKEEYSTRVTVKKFERKSLDFANSSARERRGEGASVCNNGLHVNSRSSLASTREIISPQISIRDRTAMFESRSQNQQ